MMRPAFLQSVRLVARSATRTASKPAFRNCTPSVSIIPSRWSRPSLNTQPARFYSAPAGLSKPEVEGRIMDLLKNFDKVKDASKLTGNSHFANDLGLDSLDTVEVVMAIEEEFSIEIPDKEADAILSIENAVDYILGQPDAH